MPEQTLSTQIDGHVTTDDAMEELLLGDAAADGGTGSGTSNGTGNGPDANPSTADDDTADNTPIDLRDENPYFAKRRSTTAAAAQPAASGSTNGTGNGNPDSATPANATSTPAAGTPHSDSNTNPGKQAEAAPSTIGAQAGGPPNDQNTPKAVPLKDSDLVEVNGELVEFGKLKGATIFKPEYDRRLAKLEAEREQLVKREAGIREAEPHLAALQNDPAGRVLADALLMKRGTREALSAAAAAIGITLPEPEAPKPDPRLVPPKDQHGDPIDPTDVRYVEWLAGPRTEALLEQTANRVKAEIQTEQLRAADAERAAREEQERRTRVQRSAEEEHLTRNVTAIQTLPAAFAARGIDANALTPEQWSRAKTIVAERAQAAGKDVRNDEWLRNPQNVLASSDVQLLVDASIEQVRAEIAPKVAAVAPVPEQKGPEKVPDVQTEAEIERAKHLADERSRGTLAAYYNRPLSAGSNSEMIPGRQQGYQAPKSGEDLLREADAELGL